MMSEKETAEEMSDRLEKDGFQDSPSRPQTQAERNKKYREKNPDKYREYQRNLMRKRRAKS